MAWPMVGASCVRKHTRPLNAGLDRFFAILALLLVSRRFGESLSMFQQCAFNYTVILLMAFFSVSVVPAKAIENWKGLITSQYPIGFEISLKEACENAAEQAKLDAMSLAGCEKLSFRQVETCESSSDAERCAFFQETFNAYDNCFVAKYKLLERNASKLDLNQNLVCEVAAEISIRGFKNQHDPNLIIQVDEGLNRNFRTGDEIIVRGKLSQPSFVNVLAWYPEIDQDHLYRLHSDEGLETPRFTDEFVLPPMTQTERWWAEIPEGYARGESNEFMIVLASKAPFKVMQKEARADFFRRLDEFGRENWRIARYSYRIFK